MSDQAFLRRSFAINFYYTTEAFGVGKTASPDLWKLRVKLDAPEMTDLIARI